MAVPDLLGTFSSGSEISNRNSRRRKPCLSLWEPVWTVGSTFVKNSYGVFPLIEYDNRHARKVLIILILQQELKGSAVENAEGSFTLQK